jgi:hypothetical protein
MLSGLYAHYKGVKEDVKVFPDKIEAALERRIAYVTVEARYCLAWDPCMENRDFLSGSEP